MKKEYKNLAVQHNELISIKNKSGKYSKNELKLITGLISNVHQDDNDLLVKQMDLKNLGFTKEQMRIKEINIITDSIMLKLLRFSNGDKAHWFSYIKNYTGNGILKYRFVKELVPYLIKLKDNYTKFEISEYLSLDSKYSIMLFEYLALNKFKSGLTWSWKELKENLQIPKSQRANNILNLLNDAHKEINKKTSIKYNYKVDKKGTGRYKEVRFSVHDKVHNLNK